MKYNLRGGDPEPTDLGVSLSVVLLVLQFATVGSDDS